MLSISSDPHSNYRARPHSMAADLDPEQLALLYVQQYLSERGYHAALKALEGECGLLYDDDKPARGSELMELIYQHFEQQISSLDIADDSALSSKAQALCQQTQQQQQQQQFLEDQMLRSHRGDYPTQVLQTLGPSDSNILAVKLWPGQQLVVTGSADGCVQLLSFSSNVDTEVWAARLGGAGGVISLHWHPSIASCSKAYWPLLLAGCMDGSIHVLHATTGQLLASCKPHSKYVVTAAWSSAGDLVATGAYDSTCCIVRVLVSGQQQQQQLLGQGQQQPGISSISSNSEGQVEVLLQVAEQVTFPGYVQDVMFLPLGAGQPPDTAIQQVTSSSSSYAASTFDSSQAVHIADTAAKASFDDLDKDHKQQQPLEQLLVAVRGTNCLNVLSISHTKSSNAGSTSASNGIVARVTGSVNMSEARDRHASFSAMRFALSPCSRYLLVATDSPILLVLRLPDWTVLRRLYGLDVEKFHNASCAWHRDGSYIYAGASHAAVYVYHVGSAKVVKKLAGQHTVNVRDISYDHSTNRLATCGFDKTVKVLVEAVD